jgi:hypothetical protein
MLCELLENFQKWFEWIWIYFAKVIKKIEKEKEQKNKKGRGETNWPRLRSGPGPVSPYTERVLASTFDRRWQVGQTCQSSPTSGRESRTSPTCPSRPIASPCPDTLTTPPSLYTYLSPSTPSLASPFSCTRDAPRPSNFLPETRRYRWFPLSIPASSNPLSPPFSYLQLSLLLAHPTDTVWCLIASISEQGNLEPKPSPQRDLQPKIFQAPDHLGLAYFATVLAVAMRSLFESSPMPRRTTSPTTTAL